MYNALLSNHSLNVIIILMTTLAGIQTAKAQQLQCSKELALDGTKTVVIESLEGSSFLQAYSGSTLQISASIRQKGDTWGWRYPEERPPFAIESRRKEDTLYIKMPQEFHFNTIGISTYRERLSSRFRIPRNVSVIIKKANALTVEGIYAQTIKRLVATAEEPVQVNQKPTTTTYTLTGSGLAHYTLTATSIMLNSN